MSKVIKGGTVVTADLTYVADVKTHGGVIVEIGPKPEGQRGSGPPRMPQSAPGGFDPHPPSGKCRSGAPFSQQ